jgi:ammonia channel protein AmtB
MLASIFFWPDSGILWGGKDSGSLLGIQLLGFATISCWTIIIAWLYFFSLKRCRVLKLTKAQEILGLDAVAAAQSKGIDIKYLLESIARRFPD